MLLCFGLCVYTHVCGRKCLVLNIKLTFLSCTPVAIVLLLRGDGALHCLNVFLSWLLLFFSSFFFLLGCCIKAVVHRFVRGSVNLLDPQRITKQRALFYSVELTSFTIIYESVLTL